MALIGLYRGDHVGPGERGERGEVGADVADGLFGEGVVDGVHGAIGDELDAEEAGEAGIAVLVGEDGGDVERRKLIDWAMLWFAGRLRLIFLTDRRYCVDT
jgi:hypothetical protein